MAKLSIVIDLDLCIGCNACTLACKAEHGTQRAVFWGKVLEHEVGKTPAVTRLFLPVLCNHCENPPCREVCPTRATHVDEDGVVLVDYDKCIGCKYCSWACPYGARELDEQQKVMKKCTLCIDRISDESLPPSERKPACVLACPTSARLFGDVHDPDSEVSVAIREQGGYQLMPEWGTKPANHYLPRRKTSLKIHEDELHRVDNPLLEELEVPVDEGAAIDDVAF